MCGRLFRFRNLSCLCLVQGLVLAFAAPVLAQDPPSAPAAPPEVAAPPPADAPAPTPSVPAPPNQAPVTDLPTPTPTPVAPAPSEPGASKAASPAGTAAFEPLPDSPAPAPKRTKKPGTAPVESAPVAAAAPAPEPQATSPASPASHSEWEPQKDDDQAGVLGPFRLGFLIGTGLPEIANLGAQIKVTRFIGAGVNVGLIPKVKISYYGDAQLSYQEYDAYGRIYPFGGAFFVGAGVGYATIKGTLKNSFNLMGYQAMYPGLGVPASVDVTSDASVRTLVLTPQIGFMKIFDVGFAIGFDVGAQVPIAPSNVEFATAAPTLPPGVASVVQTQYINPNDEKVRSTLEKVGRVPLPTFNFKIGWFL